MSVATKAKTMQGVAGGVEIQRFSPTQWMISLTNSATGVTESVVLDNDALDELAYTMNQLRRGVLSGAEMLVNKKGCELY